MKKSFFALLALAVFGFAYATDGTAQPETAKGTMAQVRSVNAAQGRITLKHEAIASIGMEAMTMAFTAKDPQSLQGLVAGDTVRFTVVVEQGKLFLVTIKKQE